MWVSTGKAGWPKAWFMTTEAVLWPTPGSFSSASKEGGTRPSCSRNKICESSWMARALRGARPHGRIIASMSATSNSTIASGVWARANRWGVTRLTRLSVHCADSKTATSNVYESACTSGIGVSGYNSSKMRPISWMGGLVVIGHLSLVIRPLSPVPSLTQNATAVLEQRPQPFYCGGQFGQAILPLGADEVGHAFAVGQRLLQK